VIVNVKGHGKIKFPDSMSESEVRSVLKQFETPKDNTLPKLLATFEKLLKQKPQVVTEQKIVEVEKQVIVKVPDTKIVEVDRIVEVQAEAVNWIFSIKRDDDGISQVIAEPFDNG